MKCAEFVGMLFLARDVAHSVHLNTRSYSKHKALGKFYDEIVDLADKFAEAYQGKHGIKPLLHGMLSNTVTCRVKLVRGRK